MINRFKKIAGPVPRMRSIFSGFTLVETLIAILILTVAIAGPLTIASRALNTALQSKNKTTALYLAQDAMEYIRYKRDGNCLAAEAATPGTHCNQDNAWLTGLNVCMSGSACTVDSILNTVTACSANPCSATSEMLNYQPALSIFTTSAANGTTIVPSIFTRSVTITTPVWNAAHTLSNPDDAQVKVVVGWTDVNGVSSIDRSVVLQEDLLNWQ